jgi:hypothetical protein
LRRGWIKVLLTGLSLRKAGGADDLSPFGMNLNDGKELKISKRGFEVDEAVEFLYIAPSCSFSNYMEKREHERVFIAESAQFY